MSAVRQAAPLAAAIPVGGWRDDVACTDADPDLFFAPRPKRATREQMSGALAVCARCPATGRCRAQYRELRDEWAVAGGETVRERLVALGVAVPAVDAA